MNNDKTKICKLFYRMDMFYVIIIKNNFLSQKVGPGGGASIYIYVEFTLENSFKI